MGGSDSETAKSVLQSAFFQSGLPWKGLPEFGNPLGNELWDHYVFKTLADAGIDVQVVKPSSDVNEERHSSVQLVSGVTISHAMKNGDMKRHAYGLAKALDTTELAKIVRAYHTIIDLTDFFASVPKADWNAHNVDPALAFGAYAYKQGFIKPKEAKKAQSPRQGARTSATDAAFKGHFQRMAQTLKTVDSVKDFWTENKESFVKKVEEYVANVDSGAMEVKMFLPPVCKQVDEVLRKCHELQTRFRNTSPIFRWQTGRRRKKKRMAPSSMTSPDDRKQILEMKSIMGNMATVIAGLFSNLKPDDPMKAVAEQLFVGMINQINNVFKLNGPEKRAIFESLQVIALFKDALDDLSKEAKD